jgi:dienelactone hydrolase
MVLSIAVVLLTSGTGIVGQEASGRPWTVEDSIAMRYFMDWEVPGLFRTGRPEIVSPSGNHFVIGTHRGDLSCDCTRYEMLVYSAEQVRAAIVEGRQATVSPLHTIRMASTSPDLDYTGAGIRDVRWENDDRLLLIGTGEIGNKPGVFSFDLRSGKLKRLTDPAHNLGASGGHFDIKKDTIVYSTLSRAPSRRDPETLLPGGYNNYPLQPMRRNDAIARLLEGSDVLRGMFVAKGGKVRELVPIGTRTFSGGLASRLSPDARWAVVAIPEGGKSVPVAWRGYAGLETPVSAMTQFQLARVARLNLVDTATGKMKPIWDLPIGPMTVEPTAFWSGDGKRIVLFNVSLPLTEDAENRKKTGYIVDYEVATGKWNVLASTDGVISGEWLTEGKELLIKRGQRAGGISKPTEAVVYEYTGNGWSARSVPVSTAPPKALTPVLAGGLKVQIKESPNDPPTMIATDGKGGTVTLIDQDPSPKGIRRARWQQFQWDEPHAKAQKGGLFLPPDDGSGRKGSYPLVVQLNADDSQRFWPDGDTRSAYAAQLLAAQGIAVLNLYPPSRQQQHTGYKDKDGKELTMQDINDKADYLRGPLYVQRIDAAVQELVRQGLVDPKKVGLMGFSFRGWVTYYTVTHPQKTIMAAAIVADSGLRDYASLYVESPEFAWGMERWYAGSFWDPEARKRWLEHGPTFNIDKLEAPVLFSVHTSNGGMMGVKGLIEAWGAFQINKKERDLLLIPAGSHQLHRPKQRQASLQATVDWMSFWLQGKEIDPDKNEARQAQYYYWRQLRKQRDDRWAKNGNPYDKPRRPENTASSASKSGTAANSAEKPDDQ